MIFNSLIAAIISVGATNPENSFVNSRSFFYTNLSSGMSVGLYEDRSLIGIKDVAVKARDCSTDTVVCFEAEGVFFAMPYGSVGYASDGTKVETVERKNISLFGVSTHVHVIQAARDSVQYQFFYSYERGLVAFTIALEGKTATYLPLQATGFKPILNDGSEIKHPEH